MNRLKYLDGLRGVAALIVVLHHFTLAFYPAAYSGRPEHTHFSGFQYDVFVAHSPFDLLIAGNFAVCIFFVLSGMVLSRQFLITRDSTILSEQAARRYFRLVIPILGSVLIAYIMVQTDCFYNKPVALITKSDFWLAQLWPYKYTVLQFLHIAFVDVLLCGETNLNNALWTMNFEFFGSFLVFASLALTQFLRRRFLIYALMIFAFIWIQNYYYLCFIGGIMIMDLQISDAKWFRSWPMPVSIGLLLLSLLLGSFPGGPPQYIGEFYTAWLIHDIPCAVLYHCIAAILLIASLSHMPWLQRLLETRLCLFLGRISFSMYLLHSLVLGSVILWGFLHIYPAMHYSQAFLILLAPYLGLTLLFSYFFAVYIDEKSMTVSKKIYQLYFKK